MARNTILREITGKGLRLDKPHTPRGDGHLAKQEGASESPAEKKKKVSKEKKAPQVAEPVVVEPVVVAEPEAPVEEVALPAEEVTDLPLVEEGVESEATDSEPEVKTTKKKGKK